MAFSQMLELLKQKEKGTIVFIKLGTFYIATEEDAVLLHNKLGLKCTCFKMNICKIGFPVNSLEKYVEKLNETNYAYVIYDFDKEKVELKEIIRKKGKYNKIDRIVHRWVVDNFLEPYFVPTFIKTSYACLKNKGMHKACLDVQSTMKHLSRTWKDYYILKMDIRKYFQNIDKDILYNILNRKIQDNKLLWLLKEIIYSNEGKKGLAIGNYTSQMFANIYLNEQDQYVKHKLHCKYYFRYLDDTLEMFKTKEEAKLALEKIKVFLTENLELELNKKTQIFKSKQGVNFCGYKINEYRLKIRDRR